MSPSRAFVRAALAAAATAATLGCLSGPGPVETSDGRYLMGTVLEITLYASDAATGRAALESAFARVRELEQRMTRFEAGSEVRRLERHAGGPLLPVDPDLARVLRRARAAHGLTRGAFDVTVGPLVDLWVRAAQRNRVPSPAELSLARARVGARDLRVDADSRAGLARAGMSLDLGGIAKGYALDSVASELRAAGIQNALANFGRSSLLALGSPPEGGAWRVWLPGSGETPGRVVLLRNQALSVSGSLGQASVIAGRRYGHIIDPRDGRPIQVPLRAAVIAPEATLAEVLSTALPILGSRDGAPLLASLPDVDGELLSVAGPVFATPGWSSRLDAGPARSPDAQGSGVESHP
ncbi:MAG: FAD:protein FMN transferase [Myxococcota bacterium]|nr:FAD:protein FMN transferase [Myxococcota bacterium]